MVSFGAGGGRVALVPGSNAGPYRIVEPLGRGGMATVYRAYEPALDRYVALKVLPREFLHDPGFAERFQREAKALAKLEHPNIVPIYNYDIDEGEGIPWMAMRLVAGGALSQVLKSDRPRLPFARSVEILRGVADALDYAHGKGIVHRDVKPQNVLLDAEGRVYLADFGIAKMLEASGGLTATGMITGTPQYMAPEQAMGTKAGPPADVYALGIVTYEMFTGHTPFNADTPVAVLMKHVQEPLPLPPPDTVPEALLRPLLKCTAKKPEDRWPSAGAFVDALEKGLEARTLPAVAEVPTVAVKPPAPPTVVSARTTRPPAAVPPALVPPPRVVPPPPASAPAEPPTRGGFGPLALALGGLAGVSVLGLAVGVAFFLLRGGPVPSPSPSRPPLETASPAPGPAVPPESTPPPTPAPAVASPRPARREAAVPVPTPTPVSSVSTVVTATPTPLPPTLVPASPRAAEPAMPAIDPEVVRLAGELGDGNPATRRRAAQDLAALGPVSAPALAALTTALGDRASDVRLRAAEALGRMGPPARPAVPALAQALRDADPMVRAEAAKSLGFLAEAAAGAAAPLGEALRDPDVAVRREAAKALARLGRGAEPALKALVGGLEDKDKTVRSQSARALGRIGAPAREAAARLTVLSRDSDMLVSREARAALEAIVP
jgi:serine/threonine protein kinase